MVSPMSKAAPRMTPMMEQYFAIKKQHPEAILFFRLGDFYEMFFEDALLVSRELGLTLTHRGQLGDERIHMCGVPHHAADSYIEQLVHKGYKIAICEQMSDKATASGVVQREVTQIITPGTWTGGEDGGQPRYLLSIIKDGTRYAVAAAELSTGELEYSAELLDAEEMLHACMRYQPQEILIPDDWTEEEVAPLKERWEGRLSLFPRQQRLWQVEEWLINGRHPLPAHGQAVLAQLFGYLGETQKRQLKHFQLKEIASNAVMVLDPYTIRNLELFQRLYGDKGGSLYGQLNRTQTSMGARLLRRWVGQPLLEREKIERRLDWVEGLVNHSLVREEVRLLLKQVYDLERLTGRLSMGKATPRDLVQIRETLEQIPRLKEILSQLEGDSWKQWLREWDDCAEVRERIAQAIDDEAPHGLKEGSIIRPGYHPRLDELREAANGGKRWMVEMELAERERTGIPSLKVGYNKVFGYYIEVTKTHLSKVPERYIRKQTLANAERYVTQELKEMEQRILEAEEQLSQLELQLFQEVLQAVTAEIPRLKKVAEWLATLDVVYALAECSVQHHYVRPTFGEAGRVVIREGRHPVVEASVSTSFVANDIHFSDQRQILLITGPNMAGKSTYMRQMALTAIMAQMGCFVPAAEARLPLFDRIFTRIGSADDLSQGQSTFMVEMNEIRNTTRLATSRSLIIIDELGRGTSTQDGMAIAQAVIEYLHDRIGALTMVSTHYHELAALEERLPRLKNISMLVRETGGEVLFLRRVVEEPADKSYGIYCAELAGLPEEIIVRAKELFAAGGTGAGYTAPAVGEQLSLFDLDSDYQRATQEIVGLLRDVDVMHTTPMQALQLLMELKQKGEGILWPR